LAGDAVPIEAQTKRYTNKPRPKPRATRHAIGFLLPVSTGNWKRGCWCEGNGIVPHRRKGLGRGQMAMEEERRETTGPAPSALRVIPMDFFSRSIIPKYRR
jgi:hypothetical protein